MLTWQPIRQSESAVGPEGVSHPRVQLIQHLNNPGADEIRNLGDQEEVVQGQGRLLVRLEVAGRELEREFVPGDDFSRVVVDDTRQRVGDLLLYGHLGPLFLREG